MRQFKPHFHNDRVKLENPPTGLVLTRKVGEAIIIGDDVLVTVTEIQNQKVRLCVTAPSEVQVDRVEVRAAKEAGPGKKPSSYRN